MTIKTGNGKSAQYIVLVHADAAVIVVAVEQSVSKSERIGFVSGFEGNVLTNEIASAVLAIIIEIMRIGCLVAENPVVI